jgi:hypothetical protein
MAKRVVVLCVACVLGAALTGCARSFGRRGTCGPALCFPVERGWFGSVAPGVVNARPAAWVLFGNFWFPADAAGHEANPSVPPGKVLIMLGDFPVVSPYAHCRRVERLRLPRHVTEERVVSWHVRFAGRAVPVTVRFGSVLTRRMRTLANAKLMAVHRKHRSPTVALAERASLSLESRRAGLAGPSAVQTNEGAHGGNRVSPVKREGRAERGPRRVTSCRPCRACRHRPLPGSSPAARPRPPRW